MNRIAHEFTYPGAHAVGAAALLAALALACPSPAGTGNQAPVSATGTRPTDAVMAQAGSTQAPAATEQAPAPARAAKTGASRANQVEARINELHTKLRITAEQEEQWKKVAEVMRDNANRMEETSKVRAEKATTMTAVEDLKAYADIADVHAEGIKRFVSVFEPLYHSMSDAQKKSADNIFLHRIAGRNRPASKRAQSPSKTN
jgi:periplasmic protein CpxP/Spy